MRVLPFLILLLETLSGGAQTILAFTNIQSGKIIEVHEGQTLSISYTGYLGQEEKFKSVVTEINDSTITLGFPGTEEEWWSLRDRSVSYSKVVRIKDIGKFRRITVGRQLAKSLLTAGTIVGSYFLFYKLASPGMSFGQSFLVSLGLGIGSKLAIDALLPEHPKYNMGDGWQVIVIHR